MLLLATALLITKWLNSLRRRFEAVRRASYVAVFGELTARGSYPQDILASWTDDPVFRSALVDFIRLLDGIERDRLLRVARDLGIVDAAVVTLHKSRRRKARIRAALMLAELGDPKTARPLAAALNDPESGVRINASAALAKIGEPDAVGAILASVDREKEWDAARTMDHLASLGTAAVDGLLEYLGDLSERMPTYGQLALRTLGQIGDHRAEPTLLHALASTVAETRLVAAGALQTCGTSQCVAPLISAMDDPDGRVRARAAKSLGAHFDDRAIAPLAEGLRDREWWVRKNSAGALAQLPGGIAALQRALRDRDLFARDAAREQLMTLGIPAGASDAPMGDDWVEDQLRALETAESMPDDSPDWIQDQLDVLHTRVRTLDTPGELQRRGTDATPDPPTGPPEPDGGDTVAAQVASSSGLHGESPAGSDTAVPADNLEQEAAELGSASNRKAPITGPDPPPDGGDPDGMPDWVRQQMQSLPALDQATTTEDEDRMTTITGNAERSTEATAVGAQQGGPEGPSAPRPEDNDPPVSQEPTGEADLPADPAPGQADADQGSAVSPEATPRQAALSALDEALDSHGLCDSPAAEQRAS